MQDDVKHIAKIINKICDKAGVHSRTAIAALPTFSVFSSVLNLSNVNKKDLAAAVHWEAKKVMPLALEDMILDWKMVDDSEANKEGNTKVLLTGAPKVLVKKYISIFKEAQINLYSLETETFSLIRSLLGNDKATIMIVEIGNSTSDISIAKNSIPMLSRSIDVGGLTISRAISDNLKIGLERAEQFKYDLGISSLTGDKDAIPKAILETISPIVNEIRYTINLFESKGNNKIEKIVLTGGSALLVNLANYLAKTLDMKVIVGNPWARIAYEKDLEELLNEIGPRLSVAIGLAMRGVY